MSQFGWDVVVMDACVLKNKKGVISVIANSGRKDIFQQGLGRFVHTHKPMWLYEAVAVSTMEVEFKTLDAWLGSSVHLYLVATQPLNDSKIIQLRSAAVHLIQSEDLSVLFLSTDNDDVVVDRAFLRVLQSNPEFHKRTYDTLQGHNIHFRESSVFCHLLFTEPCWMEGVIRKSLATGAVNESRMIVEGVSRFVFLHRSPDITTILGSPEYLPREITFFKLHRLVISQTCVWVLVLCLQLCLTTTTHYTRSHLLVESLYLCLSRYNDGLEYTLDVLLKYCKTTDHLATIDPEVYAQLCSWADKCNVRVSLLFRGWTPRQLEINSGDQSWSTTMEEQRADVESPPGPM